jgi:hypothetical protein
MKSPMGSSGVALLWEVELLWLISSIHTHLVIYQTHPYITNSNGGDFPFVGQCNRNKHKKKILAYHHFSLGS